MSINIRGIRRSKDISVSLGVVKCLTFMKYIRYAVDVLFAFLYNLMCEMTYYNAK